jgi:ZIP family zinc transporter
VLEAALWGLLAASTLVIGALIVLWRRPPPTLLGLVMAFGAGVLLSAVAYELVEDAILTAHGEGGTALGFFAGAVTFFVGDVLISRLGGPSANMIDSSRGASQPLAIVLGTVLDGIPESAVLGLTLLQTGTVSASMLAAVFVSNLPEAIAGTADLLKSGWTRARVVTLWVAIALASALAAGAGYALLDGASPRTIAFTLAFAGGAILAMLSTSMVPEAYELAGRPVGLLVTLGFAVALGISYASA